MANFTAIASEFGSKGGTGNLVAVRAVGQHILTLIATVARRVEDRRRVAALPRRYLDDAGIVFSERDAGLPGMDPFFPRNAANILTRNV